MSNPRHSFLLSYVDMLFAILLGIFTLFILNFLLINPKSDPGKKVDMKAEMLIVMTWDDQSSHDIDMWVLTPERQRIGYQTKENTYMALERDDLGLSNDTVPSGTGENQLIYMNREVISIRAKHPGHYVVNTFLYARKPNPKTGDYDAATPIAVKVELVQINPLYQIAAVGSTSLEINGDERTALSFDITDDGRIANVTYENVPFVLMGSH